MRPNVYYGNFAIDRIVAPWHKQADAPANPSASQRNRKLLAHHLETQAARLEASIQKLNDMEQWWFGLDRYLLGTKNTPEIRTLLKYQQSVLSYTKHYLKTYAAALNGDRDGMIQAYSEAQKAAKETALLSSQVSFKSVRNWASWLGGFLVPTQGVNIVSTMSANAAAQYRQAMNNAASALREVNEILQQYPDDRLKNLRFFMSRMAESATADSPEWMFDPARGGAPALPYEELPDVKKEESKPQLQQRPREQSQSSSSSSPFVTLDEILQSESQRARAPSSGVAPRANTNQPGNTAGSGHVAPFTPPGRFPAAPVGGARFGFGMPPMAGAFGMPPMAGAFGMPPMAGAFGMPPMAGAAGMPFGGGRPVGFGGSPFGFA